MAVTKKNIVEIDLESGNIHRSFANRIIGEGDEKGDCFGVRVTRGKQAVSLNGCSAMGYFIRADGETVIISGAIDGNTAYVELPASCYVVNGAYTLAIKLTGGGVTGTMRIVDGTVATTTTDTIIDPDGYVPDIAALMAVIGRAEAAAAEIADFSVYEELISGTDYRLVVDVTE